MMFLQKRCEKGQAAADNFLLTSNIYALLPKGIAADGPAHVLSWRRNNPGATAAQTL